MQHGFAARNGLFAALLAQGNYVGIKRVFKRTYGGFLSTFALGTGKEPRYKTDEITKGLGSKWQTDGIRVKPYAAMAGTHGTVDCVRALQEKHPAKMKELESIVSITIELGEAAFHHGGWKVERPLTSTGAQMSNAYVAVTQMVDYQVLPAQFRADQLDRDEVWELVRKVTCKQSDDSNSGATQVMITFKDKATLSHKVKAQRGVDPALSNDEILEKWKLITKDIIDDKRREEIEELVLNLEDCKDIALLGELMARETKNVIA
jgi:aconitate decarboxylase